MPENNLLVFAHNDDIAFGVAGLTRMLTKVGSRAWSIILTDQGIDRINEELAASDILGIDRTAVLSFPDGELTNSLMGQAFEEVIERAKTLPPIDNIISFDTTGYTGHMDHVFVSHLSNGLHEVFGTQYLTFRSMQNGERALWLPYFVPIPDQSFIATKTLDIESVVLDKNRAIAAHCSQYDSDGRNHIARVSQIREEHYRIVKRSAS